MRIEERVTKLEVEFELLKLNGSVRPAAPSARLLIAAEKTAAVLRAWRAEKADLLDSPDYDDYADVVQTLPMLEEAIAAVKKSGVKPPHSKS